jgi:polyferredoxin
MFDMKDVTLTYVNMTQLTVKPWVTIRNKISKICPKCRCVSWCSVIIICYWQTVTQQKPVCIMNKSCPNLTQNTVCLHCIDSCDAVQAVIYRPLTAEGQVESPMSVNVASVADKVPIEQVFLHVLQFSLLQYHPSMLHTHSSTTDVT